MAIARVEQVTDHDHDWVQELTAIKRQFQLLFFIPRRQTVVLSMRQGFWYSLWSPPYLLPKRSLSHKNVESTKQWFRLIKHIRRETALSRGIGFCFSSRHGPSDVSLRHLGWRLDLLEDCKLIWKRTTCHGRPKNSTFYSIAEVSDERTSTMFSLYKCIVKLRTTKAKRIVVVLTYA